MVFAYGNAKSIVKFMEFEKRKALYKRSPKNGYFRKLEEKVAYRHIDAIVCRVAADGTSIRVGRCLVKFSNGAEPGTCKVIYGKVLMEKFRKTGRWGKFNDGKEVIVKKEMAVALEEWVKYHLHRGDETKVDRIYWRAPCQMYSMFTNLKIQVLNIMEASDRSVVPFPILPAANYPVDVYACGRSLSLADPLLINSSEVLTFDCRHNEPSIDEVFRLKANNVRLSIFLSNEWILNYCTRLLQDGRPLGFIACLMSNQDTDILEVIVSHFGARRTLLYDTLESVTLDLEVNKPLAEVNVRYAPTCIESLWITVDPRGTAEVREEFQAKRPKIEQDN